VRGVGLRAKTASSALNIHFHDKSRRKKHRKAMKIKQQLFFFGVKGETLKNQ
jgi:hypothetical protein